MTDCIDREAIILHLNDVRWTNAPTDKMTRAEHLYAEAFCRGITEAMEAVEDFPAADVAPVVRCGECKYGKYTGAEWFCEKHSGHADRFGEDASYHEYHSKYWFCADGVAKMDGGAEKD